MDYPKLTLITRKPKRITITISDKAFQLLSHLSCVEGRSMSNLSAYLLEQALDERSVDSKSK